MSELKNCPFCGKSVAEMDTCQGLESCENFEECDNSGYSAVVCNYNKGGCGSTGKYCKTEAEAIAAWNTRTAAPRFTEAERKLKKVREYCKDRMKVQYETEYSEGYVNGANNATNEILKILEGAE